jgi:hypothetical protein
MIRVDLDIQRPSKSVFLNCPWDEKYRELMDAMILATVACGFEPRSLKITRPGARLERICTMISECAYSIHDLTRSSGGDNSRANMPLELGIAIAWQHFQAKPLLHEWLVLVPEESTYQKWVSDLGGYDPAPHDGSPRAVIHQVMKWLSDREGVNVIASIDAVTDAVGTFGEERSYLEGKRYDGPMWSEITAAAAKVLRAPSRSVAA